jgi:hypothetical protein
MGKVTGGGDDLHKFVVKVIIMICPLEDGLGAPTWSLAEQ